MNILDLRGLVRELLENRRSPQPPAGLVKDEWVLVARMNVLHEVFFPPSSLGKFIDQPRAEKFRELLNAGHLEIKLVIPVGYPVSIVDKEELTRMKRNPADYDLDDDNELKYDLEDMKNLTGEVDHVVGHHPHMESWVYRALDLPIENLNHAAARLLYLSNSKNSFIVVRDSYVQLPNMREELSSVTSGNVLISQVKEETWNAGSLNGSWVLDSKVQNLKILLEDD